ncbi:hypothetical protein ABB27_04860 [Stenotrophomonas terrae]|uniref:HEAT repeat domain-containing protein n=1 Tax=Stenotrophomonas terrae TaxID=405446 RepID=A0A0R0CVW0_9GAMM|nr:hypothetical protein [Stenotrophomonas terrae]KRG70263.1 hypothetical protein ABB27_04860 [Stenotrophomonas terrae]
MPPTSPPTQIFLLAIRRFAETASAAAVEQALAAANDAAASVPLDSLETLERHIRFELGLAMPATHRLWSRTRPARHLSWLDLCNADGHVRERTLRCLLAAPNALALAFALRRLNDWVPEVRAAAREHLPRIARASTPSHVAQALWAVLANLASWGRIEASERQTLDELIAMESVALALLQRIREATAGPAASILVQITRTAIFDPWLQTISQDAIQPAVRARALRFLLEGRATWFAGRAWTWTDLKWCKGKFEPVTGERPLLVNYALQELLESALRDPSPAVRRVAAEILIRQISSIDAPAGALAAKLAADPSAAIAERGRFALARLAEAEHNAASQQTRAL